MMKGPGMDAKRQKLPGSPESNPTENNPTENNPMETSATPGLYLVATPIGNLGDLSRRAIETLLGADWIACEDTRRTAALLHSLESAGRGSLPPLHRYDEHTSPAQIGRWVEKMLGARQRVAVVTDAGTPGVSDPGARFVQQAAAAGIPVHPVPGPSSWISLVSISGWPEVTRWECKGFFPRSARDREQELVSAALAAGNGSEPGSVARIWLESPERISDALDDLLSVAERRPEILGATQWLAAKELTKVHERVFRGSLAEVRAEVRSHIEQEGRRGEWCFAVQFPRFDAASVPSAQEPQDHDLFIECLLDAGLKNSEVARILSHRLGVSRDAIYARASALKKNRIGG